MTGAEAIAYRIHDELANAFLGAILAGKMTTAEVLENLADEDDDEETHQEAAMVMALINRRLAGRKEA